MKQSNKQIESFYTTIYKPSLKQKRELTSDDVSARIFIETLI